MEKTLGFIGCGNMGKAILEGILKSKLCSSEKIIVSGTREENLSFIKDKYGVLTTKDNTEVVKNSEILILAVKPNVYPKVIKEIKDMVKEDTIIISIAAGRSIKNIEELFEKNIKLIRIMPNTPALVGEGMTAVCINNQVNEEELKESINILKSFGKVEIIDEKLMDGFIAVSGSSPAYVFMFIEAMADAAVKEGLPRSSAYKMAAQSVLGAAKMVLDTGIHPGQLKDMVCSPGGTTIEAVIELENSGLRSSVMKAMAACADKSRKMQ